MKVLIGSLRPKQQQRLEALRIRDLELRFVTTDQDPRCWITMGKHCDLCIAVTRFISHKHSGAWESQNYEVIYHRGGLTALETLLRNLK